MGVLHECVVLNGFEVVKSNRHHPGVQEIPMLNHITLGEEPLLLVGSFESGLKITLFLKVSSEKAYPRLALRTEIIDSHSAGQRIERHVGLGIGEQVDVFADFLCYE